ncbi:MAG: response regulator [Bacteroidales bacterium]|nr:response regulator [Bacteroidales bacterium]
MHIFSDISVFFLITALISIFVAVMAWQKRSTKGGKELSLLMLFAGLWALVNTGEAGATTVEGKVLWSQIEYIPSVFVPLFYLIFAARFTGFTSLIRHKAFFLTLLFPITTIVLSFTNTFHNLVWTGFSEINPETNLIEYYHGLWFWIGNVGYNYILFLTATVLVFKYIILNRSTFKTHGWIIFIGGLGPWVASIIYIFDLSPVPGLNLTPATIIFSGILFIVAIFYMHLFDIVPIAHGLILETIRDGILVIDSNERLQDINIAAVRFLELESVPPTGTPLKDIKASHKDLLIFILRNKKEHERDLEFETESQTLQIFYQNIPRQQGSILIIIRDITEIIKQQKSIMEGELKYKNLYTSFRLMADTMPDMLWAKDLSGKYIFVNKAYCDKILIAQNTDEPIGKTEDFFIKRQQLKRPNDDKWFTFGGRNVSYDKAIQSDMPHLQYEDYGYVNGRFYHLDVHHAPLLNNEGTLIGIIGSARDITDKKEVEHALKKQDILLRGLAESNQALLQNKNLDISIQKALNIIGEASGQDRVYLFELDQNSPPDNPLASQRFEWVNKGIHPEIDNPELQNVPFKEYFPRWHERLSEGLYIAGNVVDFPPLEKQILDPQNIISLIVVPIKVEDRFWGFIGFDNCSQSVEWGLAERSILYSMAAAIGSAIERHKFENNLIQAKLKAEESNRLKSAFINNISHEIRTPLNGILSFSKFMADIDLTSEEKETYLMHLESSSQRLIQTITDYTDIALLTSGSMDVNLVNHVLKSEFDKILHNTKVLIGDKPIEFSNEIPKHLIEAEFYTNPMLFNKVFCSLINNAVKFTNSGSIRIGCNELENEFEFYVKDTGRGINQEKLETIFNAFTQEDYSISRGFEGSGLGLSIAKGILELLGGRIYVESALGKGSTFYFTVPKSPKQSKISNTETKPTEARPAVLVAEDEESNFYFLEVILKRMNIPYFRAINGQEAVNFCRLKPEIKLVLMDIKMPVVSGVEATKQIKKVRPDLFIAAITAFTQRGEEESMMEAGCDAFYVKPIDIKVLQNLITIHLGIHF